MGFFKVSIPILDFFAGAFVWRLAMEESASGSSLGPGDVRWILDRIFRFLRGALVLLGLWLVVRSHTDATTPAT